MTWMVGMFTKREPSLIQIDERTGSAELQSLFPPGVPTIVGRLEFGDFAFLGNGPEDEPVSIGVERKGIKDLLNSISTGRLAGHQLIGLVNNYHYVYIVVEGLWRFNPTDGMLEERCGQGWEPIQLGSRRFMAREVLSFLHTLMVKTGVMVFYSGTKRETVQVVSMLHGWWSNKSWDEHTAHLGLVKQHKSTDGAVELVKAPLLRRVAAELPGIGWQKSREVAKHFGSVLEMSLATEREWRQIPGIGKILAERITKEIINEHKPD